MNCFLKANANLFFYIFAFFPSSGAWSMGLVMNSTFIFENIITELIEWIFIEPIPSVSGPFIGMFIIVLSTFIFVSEGFVGSEIRS